MSGLFAWYWARFTDQIWVHIALYGVVGLATALLAGFGGPLLPMLDSDPISRESVMILLQILASSMLAVTTFSVSIMLSALGAAASGATPRATELLKADRTSQMVLATFVGAFVYSLVSISGLQLSYYGPGGRLVLFVVSLIVLMIVVAQLVHWIGHLANFGRLSDTIARIEDAAQAALLKRLDDPFLGGRAWTAQRFVSGAGVFPDTTGYVQVIDMAKLQDLAKRAGVELAVLALPGSFVHPGAELARVIAGERPEDSCLTQMVSCFVVGQARTFNQDPRFGVLTLTEIASRALSPAVNDPGTAIDILGRHLRLLALWQDRAVPDTRFDRLMVQPVDLTDLMQDAFCAIARDGAGLIEVQIRLHKMLLALVQQAPTLMAAPARRISEIAADHARAAMVLPRDVAIIDALAQELVQATAAHAQISRAQARV
jgi:uncharacterized membrane protein